MKVIRKKVKKMKEKKYCYNCDDYVNIIKTKQERTYTIHNINITVEEDCYNCKQCKEEIIDENLNTSLEKVYKKYLENYSLSIDKFKIIRKSLNLTQEQFAKALGWSKKTITRYELGQSIPQREYLTVYQKLQSNKDEIINILNNNKKNLNQEDYYAILKKVNITTSIKTIHAFLYILKNNSLFETQIMKYLFATDFETQKVLNKPLTTLKYAHAPYGPIIDERNEIINYLLNNKYIKIIFTNDEKIKFIATQEYDCNLFTKDEKEILKKVKDRLKGKTSVELSNWSHNFLGWKKTKNGQIIDYKKYINYFDLNEGW